MKQFIRLEHLCDFDMMRCRWIAFRLDDTGSTPIMAAVSLIGGQTVMVYGTDALLIREYVFGPEFRAYRYKSAVGLYTVRRTESASDRGSQVEKKYAVEYVYFLDTVESALYQWEGENLVGVQLYWQDSFTATFPADEARALRDRLGNQVCHTLAISDDVLTSYARDFGHYFQAGESAPGLKAASPQPEPPDTGQDAPR